MVRAFLTISLVSLGCGPSGSTSAKPTGSPQDPVETCERFADVCKLDGAKLGVCATRGSGFVCASQH